MLFIDHKPCPWLYNIFYIEAGVISVLYTHRVEDMLCEMRKQAPMDALTFDSKLKMVTVQLPGPIIGPHGRQPDFDRLKLISESLGNFFDAMTACSQKIADTEGPYQKATVMMCVLDGPMNGYPIGVSLSPDFVKAFETDERVTYPAVNKIVEHAWCWMTGDEPHGGSEFEMMVQPPRSIHLSVPGSASGLDPDYHAGFRPESTGYNLSCHNVDGPVQQLALLAGLAKLHDIQKDKTAEEKDAAQSDG